ncbi:MAG: ATP-binding protein [Alphaproteobacteria bacterium]|nr:ATP-binding protein [Alphaproteobacteria bacterium]
MIEQKTRSVPPRPSAMVESLRGLGYSTATALADIIDNSIAAGANNVSLGFVWDNKASSIFVLDNGRGMTEQELVSAMRLGGISPKESRHPSDLGRFGLGLKTASFSQGRCLTVASKTNAGLFCFRWDLDALADDEWSLYEGATLSGEGFLQRLNALPCGTLVLWEKLDRIVMAESSEQDFLDLMDVVERHLAMVFHRYLGASLTIRINEKPIKPWDPFLSEHPATWSSPAERINTPSGTIEVQCHVLPHKDRLDEKTYQTAAGPDGWTAQQGFYVYRNARLLVAGSWLGLGQGKMWAKEEAQKLARIRLDIPNSADDDWKIDIRKSVARPPPVVKSRLLRLAEDTRNRARRVFAHRGQIVRIGQAQELLQAWKVERSTSGLRYKIDEEHPAIKLVLEDAGHLGNSVRAMLRVIEETIPVQRIWLDTAEAHETPRTGFGGKPPAEIQNVLRVLFKDLVGKKGMSASLAKEYLRQTEPFQLWTDLIDELTEETLNEVAS